MEKNERVISYSRYNYYKYYNLHKERYKINYELKKRKDELEEKHKAYYRDYWVNQRWKTENMREYKKNNI
jgi:hypothetical protein